MLKLFNTLTRELEEFKPLKEGEVSFYGCGPTVYNFAHIGNLRSFTSYDILRRFLEYKGYKVNFVMNLTDVDDKTIRDSQDAGMSLKDFTEKYTKHFIEDLNTLNIVPANEYPKATDYIQQMVDFIKILLEKHIAYKSDDGIYFSVAKFKEYGKLSKMDLSQLETGASGRVTSDEYDKEQVSDFALWKNWDEKDGDVFWETDLGKGRPGWHIECSVMSTNLLGETFDIHMGGIDLIFPHHENEIAQSEACTGKQFVKYWIHPEHLHVDGKKMSKSLGNFYTLRDLLERQLNPMAIRYALMQNHYRLQMNFTIETVHASENALEKFRIFILNLNDAKGEPNDQIPELIETMLNDFEAALDNDLDMPNALKAVFNFTTEVNKLDSYSDNDADDIRNALKKVNTVLGVFDFREESIPKHIQELAEQRETARQNKDWALSDKLRDEIQDKGYVIDDAPGGFKLRAK